MPDSDFRVSTTIELKPEVNQADLKNAMGQIRSLIDRMDINAKALQGTQGGVKLLFGSGVSSQQRGAVTGLARDVLGLKTAMSGVNDETDKFDPKGRRNIGTILLWAAGWQIAYGAINAVKQSISGAITNFGDLEMAFVRIKQASGESNASFSAFTDAAFNVARATGTSTTEIAQAAKTWAQQGKSIAESLALTETATVAVNLTGQSTQETISQLTGVMNSWNFTTEETTLALDKFAKVADKEAVEVKDLMQGFLNVGLTAKMAGVSFEELNGMLSAVVTVTRKAGSEVGDAFRTMFTRYMRADTLSTIQTLSKVAVYVDEFGNATYNNTGRIRRFTEVYRDLVKVLPQLAQTTQAKILEQLTGARRSEIGKALLSRPDIVSRVQTEQVDAFGYSAAKNAEIMDTWTKKVASLSIAMQQLGQAIAESGLMDFLKNAVENITVMVDAFTSLIKSGKLLESGLTTLGAVVTILGATWLFSKEGATILALNAAQLANLGNIFATIAKLAGPLLVLFVGFKAIGAVLNSIKEMNKAFEEQAKAMKDLYQVTDAMKAKLADMTGVQLDERRLKLMDKMHEMLKKGNYEAAYRLANEIKATDVAAKTTKVKEAGQKADEDAVLFQKKQMENLRFQTALSQVAGVNAIEIKRDELAAWEAINDTQLDSVEHLKMQNDLMLEYVKEVNSLASAYEKVVSEGINKAIEGTGTLADIGKNILDTARKSVVEDVVSMFGDQTGIFSMMSAATKGPIAKAHLEGMTAGSKLIIQAHIAGIQAGFAGQSTAQAVANMQGGGVASAFGNKGVAGSFTTTTTGGTNQQGGTSNQGALSTMFGGAQWTQNTKPKAGAKTSGMNGGAALSGALVGYSAYTNAVSQGANQAGAAIGGVLESIGAYAILASGGNPITILGGAVLMGIGMLVSEMSSKGTKTQTTTEVKEQTNQVTSRINVTNKQLEIVNRNLVALRKGFEGWVLQESYYLRSRSGVGVNVQNEFALNMRRGVQT